MNNMKLKHTLKEMIQNNNIATLSYVCNGICNYILIVDGTKYQFEVDTKEEGNETQYWNVEYKVINLMRWLRRSIENETIIQLN